MKHDISIFFPAYNERENIAPLVRDAEKLLQSVANKYEIILVVYEKSTDGTPAEARKIAKKHKHVRVLVQPTTNPGVGAAYYIGMKAAQYPCVLFADSDNQFHLREFKNLLKFYPQYDLITGYKKKRQDPLMRTLTSKVYNILLNIFFRIGVRDADCAFKVYKKELTDRINLTLTSGLLVPELLIKARKLGYTIKELPVTHLPRTAGDATYQTGAGFVKINTMLNVIREMKLLRKELKRNKYDIWGSSPSPSAKRGGHSAHASVLRTKKKEKK